MTNNTSGALILPVIKVCNGSYVQMFSDEAIVGIIVVTAAILAFSIPANILVLIGYLKTPSALKKPSNYLLANLTIAESIIALVVIPLQLLVNFIKPSLMIAEGTMCISVGILSYPCYIAVILTMLFISIDRYYAIHTPLTYKFKLRGKRIAYMVTYSWLHAAAFVCGFGLILGIGFNTQIGICGILWDTNMAVSTVGAITHIVLPFFLLLGLNMNLVMSLRHQNRTVVGHLNQKQSKIWKARQGEGH